VTTETKARIGFGLGGLLLGGLILYGILGLFSRAEDEDRPPIIVRGGSIIFQSGDPGSDDTDERDGRPWAKYGGDWQPDHPRGKGMKWMSVRVLGSSCPVLSMTRRITLTYRASDGTETEFVISPKPRPMSGTPAPAITGPLEIGDTGDNPTLVFGTPDEGRISRIRFQAQGSGNVQCEDPQDLKIWQH
jgi:hypothetical protein